MHSLSSRSRSTQVAACGMPVAFLVAALATHAHAEAPNFAGCAQIAFSPECGHTLLTDSGGVVLIEDIGKFQVGDVVFATGTLQKDCDLGLPEFCDGLPCLVDATLGPCFKECGALVQGVECVLFQGQSGLYVLQNLGSFVVGDVVRVAGNLDPGCATFCLQGDGCVLNNSIASCELVMGCGILTFGPQGCTLFVPDGGDGSYVLADYGGFFLGDHVYVEGVVDPDVIGCFPVPIPFLVNSVIRPCEATFQACGTIVQPPFCGLALAADEGGLWLLDDTGGFGPGDRIFVDGVIVDPCFTLPECQVGGCVDVALVEPCGESFFSGCGLVVDSFACGLTLAADDGSGLYVLADFGGTDVGDRIFVEGFIDPDCRDGLGFCACILNDSVSPCIPVGDLNGDGLVNGADLGLLLGVWGTCAPLEIGCFGDLNFDGLINGADLGVLLANWTG